MAQQEIRVPDIGDFDAVPVIEILVAEGDTVSVEQSLLTLESDKATMDVPSPVDGRVLSLQVKEGDKVSEGDLLLVVETDVDTDKPSPTDVPEAEDQGQNAQAEDVKQAPSTPATEAPQASEDETSEIIEVRVPDIGDFDAVPVIEVLVAPGDQVQAEQSLVTLESDKATMDVPAPGAGEVVELKVAEGDKLSEGDLILLLRTGGAGKPAAAGTQPEMPKPRDTSPASPAAKPAAVPERISETARIDETAFAKVHASPSVRRYAREHGVDLARVNGTGPKQRVLKEDVRQYIKAAMSAPAAGSGLPQMPKVDFTKYGETETVALPRIRKLSAANLHRNWVIVPHVTQFDVADITELEAFRQENKAEADRQGIKLTMLAFLLKVSASTLLEFPELNSSLAPDGENLILKKYVNVGVAVDTQNGLVVPVVRDVDKKGLFQIARELGEISLKAREGKLAPADMQGGCFSISSLGGIGGTAFTPIVNAPEVAILGVSKSSMQPFWDGKAFVPRLMLPLSLSYDHRVIDGAQAARITGHLSELLSDIRRALL